MAAAPRARFTRLADERGEQEGARRRIAADLHGIDPLEAVTGMDPPDADIVRDPIRRERDAERDDRLVVPGEVDRIRGVEAGPDGRPALDVPTHGAVAALSRSSEEDRRRPGTDVVGNVRPQLGPRRDRLETVRPSGGVRR